MSLRGIFCGKRRNVEKQWLEQHFGWRDVGFLSLLWIMFLSGAHRVDITDISWQESARPIGWGWYCGTINCSQRHCRRGLTARAQCSASTSAQCASCPRRRPSVESVADTRIVTPSIQQYVNLKYELGCIVDMETETDITWVQVWAFLGRAASCHSYWFLPIVCCLLSVLILSNKQ